LCHGHVEAIQNLEHIANIGDHEQIRVNRSASR
jgi:hypothetical protein